MLDYGFFKGFQADSHFRWLVDDHFEKKLFYNVLAFALYSVDLGWPQSKSKVSGLLQTHTQSLAFYTKKKLRDVLFKLTWVLKTMWTPPGTTNAACSLRKSNTSWTVAENGRPLRRRQSLVFMPFMHGPGTKKGGWKGGCWGRGGNMIGGKLCKKLL